MNLHHNSSFNELISLTSTHFNLPVDAIRKDYFITMILSNLYNSEYKDCIVFKGGTSLSKCYPNSIERFSEDIDLTFIPDEGMSDKQISKKLKSIEKILSNGFKLEKINSERNDRNKSAFVWYDDEYKDIEKIKLEIGSSVRPHPYKNLVLKSYIQEYLEDNDFKDDIDTFELKSLSLNVLSIERTFIDKIMAIKRHAICGNLSNKVRHLYDVVKLYDMQEIKDFLDDKVNLKELIQLTKKTDSYYLEKRNIPKSYNPVDKYSFNEWKIYFDSEIKSKYENLHKTLLYTNEKQSFKIALKTMEEINNILEDIGE